MDEMEKRTDDRIDDVPAAQKPDVLEQSDGKHPDLGRLLRILLPAAALVLILCFVVSAVAGSPLKRVEQALQNTLEAGAKSEAGKALEESLTAGSLSIRLGLESLTEQFLGSAIDGEVSAALYTDAKNSRSALNAAAVLDGETVLDATLFAGSDALAVSSETLLPDGALGVKLTDLEQNLKKSVFSPDSGTIYALDEDSFEMLCRAQDSISGKQGRELIEQSKKVLRELYDTLMGALDRYAEVSADMDELDFADDTVKVRSVIMELDGEAMTGVAEELLQWAGDSDSLRGLLEQITEKDRDLLEAAGGEDPETYTDRFYAEVDDALANLDDLNDTLADAAATLRFGIYRKSLVRLDLELEDGDEAARLCVGIGPDVKNPSEITLQLDTGSDRYAVTYTVTENSSAAYTAELKVRENSDTVASGIISWDRKSGELRLTLSNDTDAIALGGTMTRKDKETRITIDRIEAGGESLDLDLSLLLRRSDSVPAVPGFTDVLAITDEDEFTELVEGVYENAEALLESLF